MNYSFDYDNTLIRYKYIYDEDGNITDAVYDRPHQENINLLRELASKGHRIYIVTARIPGLTFDRYIDNSPMPSELVKVLNLPIEKIVYTANTCKIPYLTLYKISEHWDDCLEQCEKIRNETRIAINEVEAPPGINDFLKNKFIRLMEEQ